MLVLKAQRQRQRLSDLLLLPHRTVQWNPDSNIAKLNTHYIEVKFESESEVEVLSSPALSLSLFVPCIWHRHSGILQLRNDKDKQILEQRFWRCFLKSFGVKSTRSQLQSCFQSIGELVSGPKIDCPRLNHCHCLFSITIHINIKSWSCHLPLLLLVVVCYVYGIRQCGSGSGSFCCSFSQSLTLSLSLFVSLSDSLRTLCMSLSFYLPP